MPSRAEGGGHGGRDATFTCESGDIVLEDDRDTMEGSAGPDCAAFEVERGGLFECTGICLDDGAESRPLEIHLLDPCEVRLWSEISTSMPRSIRQNAW